MIKSGKVGPISISLIDEGLEKKIVDIISSELELSNTTTAEESDIEFNFVEEITDEIYSASRYSAKGNLNFNEDSFFVAYNQRFNYVLVDLFKPNSPIKIYIATKKNNKALIVSFIRTILFPNSNYKIDTAKEIMSFSFFWYVFNVALIKKKSVFLHAGIFVNNNSKAVALTGTGGGGKTSTLFNILNDNGQYLSEDFGIISHEKKTYFSPKTISLYHSDVLTGQPIFNHYVHKKLKGITKIKWFIASKLLGLNPMLKVPIKEMADAKASANGYDIGVVVYLIRTNSNKFELSDVSVEEFTERVFYSSQREMKALNEIMMLIRANAKLDYFPSVKEFSSQVYDLYYNIFKGTTNKVLYIPHRSTPEQVKIYLSSKGILDI